MPTTEATIEELLQKYSTNIFQGQLKKIVEIYDLEWIVVHELVQNAIDAIQANPQVTEGQVDLVLDIDSDAVTVTDNGTGFTCDPKLLCPGGSGAEKNLSLRSPAKGYQGVGLKAVMYSTTLFEIESQTNTQHWTFIAENLARYIDSEENYIPEYVMEETDSKSDKTYTTVKAHFRSNTLDKFLSDLNRFLNKDSVGWQVLYKKEKEDRNAKPTDKYLKHFFSWYFRTQSYVGCANKLLNIPVQNVLTNEFEEVKPVMVRLHLKSKMQFAEVDGTIGDWLRTLNKKKFTTEIPNRAWDYSEIAMENHNRAVKYHEAPKVVTIKPNDLKWDKAKATFRNRFLDLKLTPNYTKSNFHERYADFIALLKQPGKKAKPEDFEDVFEKVTGIYLAIGRTSYFEMLGITNHGIRVIASNGTPTDHDLTVVSTSSTWYLETIHMVINVDENLNLGKRHLVNNHLVKRIKDFFKACYPVLVNISKLFVERDTDQNDDMPDVIKLERLRRENIPFRRFPEDESTLIGLFSVALSRLDEKFSVYGYFRRARYDGKFLWITEEPKSEKDLLKLEFKVKLQGLIDEFDHAIDNKEFREVNLIIVWDRRCSGGNGWVVKGAQTRRNELKRQGVPTNIVDYVLEDQYSQCCPLICVADLLQKFDIVNGETDDLDAFVKKLG